MRLICDAVLGTALQFILTYAFVLGLVSFVRLETTAKPSTASNSKVKCDAAPGNVSNLKVNYTVVPSTASTSTLNSTPVPSTAAILSLMWSAVPRVLARHSPKSDPNRGNRQSCRANGFKAWTEMPTATGPEPKRSGTRRSRPVPPWIPRCGNQGEAPPVCWSPNNRRAKRPNPSSASRHCSCRTPTARRSR